MPFLNEARRLVVDPNTAPLLRATLEYMIGNCVGRANATPIDTVVQHQVLVPSREGDLYVASYGYFGRGGIYLIETREDAQPMIDFYEGRIASEQEHLDHLVQLRNQALP